MSGHIVPTRVYFTIFALLMLGTYLTVQAAYLDLGPMNSAVALVIAVTKAVLVVLYFMHVKYSPRLTLAVVSNSDGTCAESLEAAGLRRYFGVVTDSADVGGERGAGLRVLLLDPHGDWPELDCERAADLSAVADRLQGVRQIT